VKRKKIKIINTKWLNLFEWNGLEYWKRVSGFDSCSCIIAYNILYNDMIIKWYNRMIWNNALKECVHVYKNYADLLLILYLPNGTSTVKCGVCGLTTITRLSLSDARKTDYPHHYTTSPSSPSSSSPTWWKLIVSNQHISPSTNIA